MVLTIEPSGYESVTVQMRGIEQHFTVLLLIMLSKMVLNLASVDGMRWDEGIQMKSIDQYFTATWYGLLCFTRRFNVCE